MVGGGYWYLGAFSELFHGFTGFSARKSNTLVPGWVGLVMFLYVRVPGVLPPLVFILWRA